ncbi:MAG: hypothetical protein EXR79_01010 [Myxococcales bacterium]|nr:hypothetical protein [Myxococcales bacterium]
MRPGSFTNGWRNADARQPTAALAVLAVFGAATGCGETATSTADASVQDAGAGLIDGGAFDIHADPWPKEKVGATARYDLAGKGWHDQPFPTDLRRKADGKPDIGGFPAPTEGSPVQLLDDYLKAAQWRLDGWSIQPTIYVPFDAPLAKPTPDTTPGAPKGALLPLGTGKLEKPVDTVVASSPYVLVDVTPASPEYGQFVPVAAALSPAKRGQYLEPNLLIAQPVWGRPLKPKTTYAFVVRRGFRDAAGSVLGRPVALAAALDGAMAGKPPTTGDAGQLASLLAPLVKLLQDGKLAVPYKDIAAATVFTTGNPTSQLTAMAEWVRTKAKTAAVTDWKRVKDEAEYTLYTASYVAPNFQQGKCPYDEDGGFAFAPDGSPTVQRDEPLRVALVVPKDRRLEQEAKVPIVLSAHGTGGNWMSFLNSSGVNIAKQLTGIGAAVISIDQPMHGPRCDPPIKDLELDLKTFNFLNLEAGLSGFRQSALDSVFLTRMVREGKFQVPEAIAPNGVAVGFDPQRMAFIGHSQGGLSGALAAAVEPNLGAYVLSGAGAGISLTLLLRKDPADISKAVAAFANLDDGELTEFHPITSLIQMLADVTDPLAYGHLVFKRSKGVRPPHILLTEGLKDAQTPSATSEALAAALGLDVLAPMVHLNDAMKVRKTKVLDGPVSLNLIAGESAVTGIVSQWDALDHFVIFKSPAAGALYTTFLSSALESGDATAVLK